MKSFGQNERIVTSPWLPIVWPFKFMMPVAAVLLLLQGIAEFVALLGAGVRPRRRRRPRRAAGSTARSRRERRASTE